MSEDFLKVLKAKAQQFEQTKERSLTETRNQIDGLITQIKKLENDLLTKHRNTIRGEHLRNDSLSTKRRNVLCKHQKSRRSL